MLSRGNWIWTTYDHTLVAPALGNLQRRSSPMSVPGARLSWLGNAAADSDASAHSYPVGGAKYGVILSNTTTGAPLAVTP